MNVKAITAAFRQQGTQFLADPQWIIPSIIAPFMFTVVALYMYSGAGELDSPIVLTAVLGGGVLGMWGNMLFSSGFTITYDRYNGTMEPIMLTPTHLIDVIAGRSVWNVFIGMINAVLVFISAQLIFGVGVSVADPLLFFPMLLMTLFSLASIGLMLAALFVLTRASYVITTILEFPIYVFSGALFPITALPEALRPISYIFAPTWGVDALKTAAISGYNTPMASFGIWFDVLMMFLLIAVYIIASYFLFMRIERNIRESGTLARY
ncbi:MAG: ABC transporter permease [Methanomassiliicoccaceae archaeon]|jgi:ABC-2 type transport system permease protein|nr:ABC transporter permease [Methanomassiliicoccaceae archaeon]